ncbi:unnamed protein product [Rotaria sp. Silwood2]|nr:unnamed protein product [Rotaria sp. Silwood2]
MPRISEKEKEFGSIVLGLKNLNPSWQAPQISRFLQQAENPPSLRKHQLLTKVGRVLKRNTINDKQRSGCPVTVTTSAFQGQVKSLIRLKKGASIRNVASILNKKGIECCPQTKSRLCQTLRKKFGTKKSGKYWEWDRVVNTDFSGKFTLESFRKKKNHGICAEEWEIIPPPLLNASTDKFKKGIIFWGAISSRGLIPAEGPVNLTKWLHQQQQQKKKDRRKYLTSDLYAKFLQQKSAPAIKLKFKNTNLVPIFQDDQDNKHRTNIIMNTVDTSFDERIDPEVGDAKFADVWPIETVWGAIKEKLREETFENELQLEKRVVKEWKTFTVTKCQQMMEKIPSQLKLVIDQEGEHINGH